VFRKSDKVTINWAIHI